jgi:KipI family sensor histidine kinase inhibitor
MSEEPPPVVACGDDALRVVCGPTDRRHELAHRLSADRAWVEVVPGKFDVTVAFNPHKESMDEARRRLEATLRIAQPGGRLAARQHILDAVFGGEDGPDLQRMAESAGLAPGAIADAVARSVLKVDTLGFTPGFAYLSGLDPALASERLGHPRVRVPPGSIGLITGQLGLYALEGPGGWPLIGRLLQPVFDSSKADPFLLRAGDEVRIRWVRTI